MHSPEPTMNDLVLVVSGDKCKTMKKNRQGSQNVPLILGCSLPSSLINAIPERRRTTDRYIQIIKKYEWKMCTCTKSSAWKLKQLHI
jgi:hypothetical protein